MRMPCDATPAGGVALFLFAHQDDEVAVFHCIEKACRDGGTAVCCFLTDGSGDGAAAETRNHESLNVLTHLGVSPVNVLFPGTTQKIRDRHLHESLDTVHDVLVQALQEHADRIFSIYAPAWEGGHPDHDATHLLARRFALSLDHPCEVWQFPLYHGEHCPGPLFKAFSPLRHNGAVTCLPIPWRRRLAYFMYSARFYPTARKTWLGLMPFLAYRYTVHGCQPLQRADNPLDRPHGGMLYYEKRRFARFDDFMAHSALLRAYLAAHEPCGPVAPGPLPP